MIEARASRENDGYDIVTEFVLKYWEQAKVYGSTVLVKIAYSFDSTNWDESNEIAYYSDGAVLFHSDWYENQKYIRIYGLIDLEHLEVPNNAEEILKNFEKKQRRNKIEILHIGCDNKQPKLQRTI